MFGFHGKTNRLYFLISIPAINSSGRMVVDLVLQEAYQVQTEYHGTLKN